MAARSVQLFTEFATEFAEVNAACKIPRESFVVADKNQRNLFILAAPQQYVQKFCLAIGVKGRGWLIGDDQFGVADERAGCRYALLLPDRKRRCRLTRQRCVQPQLTEQMIRGFQETSAPLDLPCWNRPFQVPAVA